MAHGDSDIKNRANNDCCTPDVQCLNELCYASVVVYSKIRSLAKNLVIILSLCQLDRKHIKGSYLSGRNKKLAIIQNVWYCCKWSKRTPHPEGRCQCYDVHMAKRKMFLLAWKNQHKICSSVFFLFLLKESRYCPTVSIPRRGQLAHEAKSWEKTEEILVAEREKISVLHR